MKYKIRHTTTYQYAESVTHCYNLGYILLRETELQQVLDTKITVTPKPDQATVRLDYYKNRFYHFSIEEPHDTLDVTVHSLIDVSAGPENILENPISCQQVLNLIDSSTDPLCLMAREFTLESPFIKPSDEIKAYAEISFSADRPYLESVMELTQRIFKDFTYDPGFSNISTPLKEVMQHRRGVCQDFAHLAIACMRSLKLPARYISGYLETVPPPGQKKLVGADATHAWFAAFVPEMGWVDFDPTNNTLTGHQHITTAWGRDYSDVPPLKGILFGGGDSSILNVEVDVNPIVPKPKPEHTSVQEPSQSNTAQTSNAELQAVSKAPAASASSSQTTTEPNESEGSSNKPPTPPPSNEH
jgi:transglutaminase-like putative cysteine protease